MKKEGILNSELAKIADDLGHTDQVCIGDLGLPVPIGTPKIDLALTRGKPSFQEVLDIYLENILVEKVYLAEQEKIHLIQILFYNQVSLCEKGGGQF